jgi:hypothetical protein
MKQQFQYYTLKTYRVNKVFTKVLNMCERNVEGLHLRKGFGSMQWCSLLTLCVKGISIIHSRVSLDCGLLSGFFL